MSTSQLAPRGTRSQETRPYLCDEVLKQAGLEKARCMPRREVGGARLEG